MERISGTEASTTITEGILCASALSGLSFAIVDVPGRQTERVRGTALAQGDHVFLAGKTRKSSKHQRTIVLFT